jgi:hypothetical protein
MAYSSNTTLIKPFRSYDEHDVVNLFAFDGTANKGTLVKVSTGWSNTDSNGGITPVANPHAASYNGTVSQYHVLTPRVTEAGTGDAAPLGVMLNDVRITDDNGEYLIYKPARAAELSAVASGQAVPVLTKGLILYKVAGISAGHVAFSGPNGTITGAATVPGANTPATRTVVGKFLGATDSDGFALLKLDL